MASQGLKNGHTDLLRPLGDNLSDSVVTKGITSDLDGVLFHLLEDVLLLLDSSGACHDYLNHAEPIPIDTEIVDLVLDLIKNKVENSVECC